MAKKEKEKIVDELDLKIAFKEVRLKELERKEDELLKRICGLEYKLFMKKWMKSREGVVKRFIHRLRTILGLTERNNSTTCRGFEVSTFEDIWK